MKFTDKVYRNTEETPAGNQKLEGVLNVLENFGGGSGATKELREELGAEAPVAQVVNEPTIPNSEESIHAALGANQVAEETSAPAVENVTPGANEGAVEPVENSTEENSPVSHIFEDNFLSTENNSPEKETYSEDITKFISSEFGVESPAELKAKLNEYNQVFEKVSDLESKLEGNNNIFQNMPQELYNAMTAYFRNEEDWKSHVSNEGLDFTKEPNTYGTEKLVNTFFPNKFSEADWEEYNDADGDVNVKRAIDMAKEASIDKFGSKKEQIVGYQSKIAESQQRTQKLIEESIASSISQLPNQMKGLKPAYIKDVESKIRNNQILDLFYNKDGTLKPDAAYRFVHAQDGPSLLEQTQKMYKVQANNEVTQEILDRAPATPDRTAGGSSAKVTDNRTDVQKMADNLEKTFTRGNFF